MGFTKNQDLNDYLDSQEFIDDIAALEAEDDPCDCDECKCSDDRIYTLSAEELDDLLAETDDATERADQWEYIARSTDESTHILDAALGYIATLEGDEIYGAPAIADFARSLVTTEPVPAGI